MTSDITLSARPKASGRLAHSRSFPSSGVSAVNPVAGAVQLADPQQILQGNTPGRALVMILPLRISPGPRKTNTTCAAATGKLTRKLPMHHPLRHLGHS
jgi:hypothetical protein